MKNVQTNRKRLQRLLQVDMFPVNPKIESEKERALKIARKVVKESRSRGK